MKSSIVEFDVKSTKSEYPCLKKYETKFGVQVVLFTSERSGVYIYGIGGKFGMFANDWIEDKFKPFHGTITLEQE